MEENKRNAAPGFFWAFAVTKAVYIGVAYLISRTDLVRVFMDGHMKSMMAIAFFIIIAISYFAATRAFSFAEASGDGRENIFLFIKLAIADLAAVFGLIHFIFARNWQFFILSLLVSLTAEYNIYQRYRSSKREDL